MTPERMDTVVGPAARNLTGFAWLSAYFTHTAHHRAQAEVHLRVKGIKPRNLAGVRTVPLASLGLLFPHLAPYAPIGLVEILHRASISAIKQS